MAKIAILFGAGAEGRGQLGLPLGEGFKRDVILAKNVASFANHFLQKAESKIDLQNGIIISHNSSSILYQTIVETQEHNAEALEILFPNIGDREVVNQYLQYKRDRSRTEEGISKKFTKLYKEKFYDALKNAETDISSNPISFFLTHAGIYSFLDSLFNYLRKPESYKRECARVIKIYYSALLSVLNGMSESIDNSKNKQLLDAYSKLLSENDTIDDPQELLATVIDGFQTAVVEGAMSLSNEEKEKLYYYNVRNLVESNNNEISCITTNYTNIGQKIIQLPDERFSYLHGKLGMFEELETKYIADIKEVDLGKTVFPYLLVQSGVKPIISPFQIREFYKACSMITEADHMLIVGYGVNLDDEHITTILRERLMNGKKVKYFVHCTSKESEEWNKKVDAVKSQLGYDNQLEFYRTGEFKEVVSALN